MSIEIARRTLNRAFAELDQAEGDIEKIRQAAEKAWRAAREAVYAVLRKYGIPTQGRTIAAPQVADFEATALQRPRGGNVGQPLTDGYIRAREILHGVCFYEGIHVEGIVEEMKLVNTLIEQAESDLGRIVRRRRSKKHRGS